jgi:hypothetical protein
MSEILLWVRAKLGYFADCEQQYTFRVIERKKNLLRFRFSEIRPVQEVSSHCEGSRHDVATPVRAVS